MGAVLTWAGLMGTLAGCGGDTTFGKPRSAKELIRVTPDDGAKGARANEGLQVTVAEGRLESVKVVRVSDLYRIDCHTKGSSRSLRALHNGAAHVRVLGIHKQADP